MLGRRWAIAAAFRVLCPQFTRFFKQRIHMRSHRLCHLRLGASLKVQPCLWRRPEQDIAISLVQVIYNVRVGVGHPVASVDGDTVLDTVAACNEAGHDGRRATNPPRRVPPPAEQLRRNGAQHFLQRWRLRLATVVVSPTGEKSECASDQQDVPHHRVGEMTRRSDARNEAGGFGVGQCLRNDPPAR